METSPTTHWEPRPTDDADVAWLLRALFAEPAPEGTDADAPDCGFNAACERFDRHLAWFDADTQARTSLAEVA